MKLKNRLRDIRLVEYKMDNKKEFAAYLGINYRQYLRYEDGIVPDPLNMFLIAKRLNKKIEDIWYLVEE